MNSVGAWLSQPIPWYWMLLPVGWFGGAMTTLAACRKSAP